MLTADGRAIEFQESGEGPVVMFVPGSFSTYTAWRGVQKHLPPGYCFITTSLCGYGATHETRSPDDLAMAHEVRVVEAVADRIDGPVHLVGHSFGGAIALASALAGVVDVRSLALFEANPLLVIRERGQGQLFESVRQMSTAFETAQRAGERDAAARIIDFWGGEDAFAAMPEVVQDYCRASAATNVLDWHTAFSFEARLADYARLAMPVLLARGALANPAMVEITEALKASLPNAHPAVVEGASHFLITSHAEECAGLLAGFLAGVAE